MKWTPTRPFNKSLQRGKGPTVAEAGSTAENLKGTAVCLF